MYVIHTYIDNKNICKLTNTHTYIHPHTYIHTYIHTGVYHGSYDPLLQSAAFGDRHALDGVLQEPRHYIHSAAGNGFTRVVDAAALAVGGPDRLALLNAKDAEGNTPLMKAAKAGRCHCVQYLIEVYYDYSGALCMYVCMCHIHTNIFATTFYYAYIFATTISYTHTCILYIHACMRTYIHIYIHCMNSVSICCSRIIFT